MVYYKLYIETRMFHILTTLYDTGMEADLGTCINNKPGTYYIVRPCHETPLPQRPSAANSYYNPLAVRVHPPVPASSVLNEIVQNEG